MNEQSEVANIQLRPSNFQLPEADYNVEPTYKPLVKSWADEMEDYEVQQQVQQPVKTKKGATSVHDDEEGWTLVVDKKSRTPIWVRNGYVMTKLPRRGLLQQAGDEQRKIEYEYELETGLSVTHDTPERYAARNAERLESWEAKGWLLPERHIEQPREMSGVLTQFDKGCGYVPQEAIAARLAAPCKNWKDAVGKKPELTLARVTNAERMCRPAPFVSYVAAYTITKKGYRLDTGAKWATLVTA